MEYRVRVWSALHGHVVPLRYVAEAMAKRAATAYGTLTLHGPTLENLRPERVRLLWDAAMSGQLTVCDSQGRIASATELVETARASAAELAGDASVAPINAENILPFLYTSHHHLIEWGKARGNVFLFVETPGTVVDSDLRNFTEAGYGEVIEPGYWRSFAGGGESEPWRDDLYVTAPVTTLQEQNTAAPAPVVIESASDSGKPGKDGAGTVAPPMELVWGLRDKPAKLPGYSEALWAYLVSAHSTGKPRRPRASDIVDMWKREPIFPVTSVDDGIVSYDNANGVVVTISKTRKGNLDAIRKAIGRMTTKRGQKTGR